MPSLRGIGAAALIGSATLGVNAGDLDPPGAPFPTAGPEARIALSQENTPGDGNSRFRITSPGSYYLTGNVSLGVAFNGIEIGSSNVTVDLNGFRLGRSLFMQNPPLSGIAADADLENITVRNGVIRSFTESGVRLTSVDGALIENVIATDNGDYGIRCRDGSVVTRCVVDNNGVDGILVGDGCTVTLCSATNNTGDGIRANDGSTIATCSARGNGGRGFGVHRGSSVIGCTAASNGEAGILAFDGNLIRECDVSDNGGHGISGLAGNRIVGNHCFSNEAGDESAAGIRVGSGGNHIEGNSVFSSERGIEVSGVGTIVVRNTVRISGSGTAYVINNTSNTIGPIVVGTNPITTTNPWANFEL